jgi:hypothetical protein
MPPPIESVSHEQQTTGRPATTPGREADSTPKFRSAVNRRVQELMGLPFGDKWKAAPDRGLTHRLKMRENELPQGGRARGSPPGRAGSRYACLRRLVCLAIVAGPNRRSSYEESQTEARRPAATSVVLWPTCSMGDQ